ncbi:MAG: hypothetical protein AAFV53_42945 [Myxococcota bacterium]
MKLNVISFLGATGILALSACDLQVNTGADDLGMGARLTVDYYGDTDVVGHEFDIERVSCDGESIDPYSTTQVIDLANNLFPGMITELSRTIDGASEHIGSDLFLTLDEGCYDITVTPLREITYTADGDVESTDESELCAPASLSGVEVSDEGYEEVILFNQCVGDPLGTLDVLTLINHPPVVLVEFEDDKYNYECEPVTVCATAFDADKDPIAFDWSDIGDDDAFSGPTVLGAPAIVAFEDVLQDGNPLPIWEQCVEIVTRFNTMGTQGEYEFKVEAFDLMGDGTRFEDFLQSEYDDDSITSSASLDFPLFTTWSVELACTTADGQIDYNPDVAGVQGIEDSIIVRDETCTDAGYTTDEQYYCNPSNRYNIAQPIRDVVCDGTDLIESELYPACN